MTEQPPNMSFLMVASNIPRTAPRGALIPPFVAGAIVAAVDLGNWVFGFQYPNIDTVGIAISVLAWVLAGYWMVTGCTRTNRSWKGAAFFSAAAAMIVMPSIAGFGLAMAAKSIWGTSVSAPTFIVCLLIAAALAILLPAWPIAQARLLKFISPLTVLRATKGHRWGLFSATVVAGTFGKLIPHISDAHNRGEATLLVLGHLILNGVSNMAYASIAVASWVFASQNDDGLRQ